MRVKDLFFCGLCTAFFACTNDEVTERNSLDSNSVKKITVTMPQIEGEATTRTIFDIDATRVVSSWAEDDTLGIFPEKGNQVEFPLATGSGFTTAVFDGGSWGLRNGNKYAAYYPYNKANVYRTNKTILLDYTGQVQTGNNNYDHLATDDYMASDVIVPVDGTLNLNMKRLGALVKFDLTIPENTHTSIYEATVLLTSDTEFVLKADLDISGETPVISSVETSNIMSFDIKNVEIPDSRTITLYTMLYPMDLSETGLGVSVNGSYDSNTGERFTVASRLPLKNVEAGKAYVFEASEMNADMIIFADPLVRDICIQNWDTNRDGGLSMLEAAAVTSLGTVFKEKDITYFDELQYFTGLSEIGTEAFMKCSKLNRVILPSSINYISDRAFYMSALSNIKLNDKLIDIANAAFAYTNLYNISIPKDVISIGQFAFYNCSNLKSVYMQNEVLGLGQAAFSMCTSLEKINLSTKLTRINPWTFASCGRLSNITIPSSVKSIDDGAFRNSGLTEVSLPEGLESIGIMSFFLEDYYVTKNLTIPSTVTSIGSEAFDVFFEEGNNNVSVTVLAATPPTITIASSQNYYVSYLNYISMSWWMPTYASVFNYYDYPVYVPAESLNAYKAAEGWSDIADRIYPIP